MKFPVLMIRILLKVVMYLREEQKHTWRLNGTTFRELTKSLQINVMMMMTCSAGSFSRIKRK
uniref:Uncharacterized protein n=1 Tax=Brassica oleracea TaxID=3712 RepID=A0A3P6DSZ9_BRAOL|nr:unnamed protein product [Brassica oleracea]